MFSYILARRNKMIHTNRSKLEVKPWWVPSLGRRKDRNFTVNTMKQNYIQLTRVFMDDDAMINKKLPKELLLRIFSYLDVVSLCRCAQVSKMWNELALDGSNWQRIDLFDFQTDVENTVVENIARRCGGFLKKLSLRGCQSVVDSSLRTFAQHTCQSLSRSCSKLQHLNLNSCSSITDVSLKALSDGCPQMMHINISWCVDALARGCPKLRTFISKGCTQINDRAVSSLANFCTNLEVINLHGCHNLTDDAVQQLAENCPRLRYLCLSGCSHLTDTSLQMLAQHCQSLSTLEVAGCSQFTDTGFHALAKSCRLLEKMDLEECVLITDSTLFNLAMGCPRLEKLSLSHCELITDDGIRHLSTSPCAAESLTVLELDNCPLITDASLEHLTSCYNLQRIELYDCQLITRAGIQPLAQHQSARILCTSNSSTFCWGISTALLSLLCGVVSVDLAPQGQRLMTVRCSRRGSGVKLFDTTSPLD
ncbi:hypothetical protein B566_EDAN002333 [Ephemera danica]|nr:hypothetical protein B566_EDAN002333 [Ephemera danica]